MVSPMTFNSLDDAKAWASTRRLDTRDGFMFALGPDGWFVIQGVRGSGEQFKRPDDL